MNNRGDSLGGLPYELLPDEVRIAFEQEQRDARAAARFGHSRRRDGSIRLSPWEMEAVAIVARYAEVMQSGGAIKMHESVTMYMDAARLALAGDLDGLNRVLPVIAETRVQHSEGGPLTSAGERARGWESAARTVVTIGELLRMGHDTFEDVVDYPVSVAGS